ncbi:MAG: hypothetical protein HFG79_16835 [Lachnospiraceae bacterium]|jgi:hypothetical protein|nr:hypothetical protein [Lachnospiraceae bacterium]
MNLNKFLKSKNSTGSIEGTAILRQNLLALFESAAMEYTMEYTTSNAENIHIIAFGKMMAYCQLATVLCDGELAARFEGEINRLLTGRKNNK